MGDESAHELGFMRGGSGAMNASFVGSASGIHFIQSVYGAVSGTGTNEETPAQNLVPGEDDHLTGVAKTIWQVEELTDRSNYSFDDLVAWSSSYFDFWHAPYPFLVAPSVLQMLEAMAAGQTLGVWDMIVVRSIMSISLADARQSGTSTPIPRQLVFTSFDEALESIQPAVIRPATLPSLQAALAVQLFLVSMLRLNAASRLGGLIVRMAYQLGLHRCPTRFPGFSKEDQSRRRRVFECIYCLERHISHALGLPLTIRDDDVDVCHFDSELHSQEPVERDDRLALLTFLSKMAGIRGSIMELRNKNIGHRDSTADTPVLLNTRLKRWWNNVDDALDQVEPDQTISPLHRAVIQVLREESIIILNRPLIALPKEDTKYEAGLQSCLAAAKSIISILWRLLQQPTGTCPLVWPTFTWATWMSSFIIIYGAIGSNISHEVSLRAIERAKTILQALARRGSVWPSACAVAIENLQKTLQTRSTASEALMKSLGISIPSSTVTDSDTGAGRSRAPMSMNGLGQSSESTQDVSATTPRSQSTVTNQRAGHIQQTSNGGQTLDPEGTPRPQMFGTATQNMPTQLPTSDPPLQGWSDTGILPKDIPPYSFDFNDPLQGFDIPFWVGQDNYVSWTENL